MRHVAFMARGAALAQVDDALRVCARQEAALRLRLGQLLEALGAGGCFELGFSSLGAYALERAERSVRWAESARSLARRLEGLPLLRAAVATGRMSWSMGELLARHATARCGMAHDEAAWMRCAQGRTLREVRLLCAAEPEAVEGDGLNGSSCAARAEAHAEAEDDEAALCMLTFRASPEDSWLFEATRALLEALGSRGAEAQVEALLAEGQDTLFAALPGLVQKLEELPGVDSARERWLEQLRLWRSDAETLAEARFRHVLDRAGMSSRPSGVAREATAGMASLAGLPASELDAMVRQLARSFASHELELARLALELHRMEGWRQLGYATEAQYARERLGMSRSSLLGRHALARRLELLPQVTRALGDGHIGVEAALQLVRVATPRTEAAWVERARQRTVKHLREEVVAALTAIRASGESDCPPPFVAELEAFHALERAVVSGRACQIASEGGSSDGSARKERSMRFTSVDPLAGRAAWSAMLQSLASWLERGVQFSAASPLASGPSSVEIRLRVSFGTRGWWRSLERLSSGRLPPGMSWLKFLCLCAWRSWQHLLGENVAYGDIYIRDRHRCSSPVCGRRDVTPHHLVFRSAGGSDRPRNILSLCTWCHLFGVHGGRIRARGSASLVHWELGPVHDPCLRVDGRRRRQSSVDG